MEYKFRLWLTNGNKKVFGEGPVELLRKVDELGSLRQAAMAMDMSYSKAWKIIKTIEEEFKIPILERYIGGAKGGGSTITKEARELINKYHELKEDVENRIEEQMHIFYK